MASAPTDWQLDCTELKQRGAYLLQTGQWSDCTFLVGTEPNQVVVVGHKLILAMASPVFEAMFYGGMAERNEPIPIVDVQIDAFRALLEYIYTGNINISSFDKACELCYGAKKYMLPHLVKECTRYLWSDLYPRNACRAYEFARLFEENVLMEKCIQIISTNTKEVLNDSSFEEVELNTVITVFSLDHLNVDSELDLFEAAVRYAKAMEKRNIDNTTPPTEGLLVSETRQKSPVPSTSQDKEQVVNIDSSAESSPEGVMETCKSSEPETTAQTTTKQTDKLTDKKEKPSIRSAVEKIRFLTLSPQQFAAGPARSVLLSESEAFAVLMHILNAHTDVPLPPGFSASRVPRKQLIGGNCNMPTFTVDTPSPVSVEQVWGELHPRPSRHDGVKLPPSIHNPVSGMSVMEHMERHSDGHKIYCQRAIVQHTDCLNTSALDCSVTFMVDKNICLLGVQVPTQAPSEETGAYAGGGAAVRAPAGRRRGAPHLHALHAPRALPAPAGHHVQQTRLHTEEQGVQGGHRVQQGGLVPHGLVRAAGDGGGRVLQLRHRPQLRLRAGRPHPLHYLHLLAERRREGLECQNVPVAVFILCYSSNNCRRI